MTQEFVLTCDPQTAQLPVVVVVWCGCSQEEQSRRIVTQLTSAAYLKPERGFKIGILLRMSSSPSSVLSISDDDLPICQPFFGADGEPLMRSVTGSAVGQLTDRVDVSDTSSEGAATSV